MADSGILVLGLLAWWLMSKGQGKKYTGAGSYNFNDPAQYDEWNRQALDVYLTTLGGRRDLTTPDGQYIDTEGSVIQVNTDYDIVEQRRLRPPSTRDTRYVAGATRRRQASSRIARVTKKAQQDAGYRPGISLPSIPADYVDEQERKY